MITELPIETAARKHRLSIGNQREDRLQSLIMRAQSGSYTWAVHDLLDAISQAMEPDRLWCPFYREFVDVLGPDA